MTHPAINEIQLPDGTVTQHDLQKAEAFNQFFTSIFTKEAPVHLPSLHIDHLVDLKLVGLCTCYLYSVVATVSCINLTPTYKSPGPDGWPLWALEETADSSYMYPLVYSLFQVTGYWSSP